jgi:hypothetical protein
MADHGRLTVGQKAGVQCFLAEKKSATASH